MAAIAVALETYALIQEINNVYSSVRNRIEITSRNPQLAKELAELFQRLQTELSPLVKQCENNDVQFPDEYLNVFDNRVGELKMTMQNITQKLAMKMEKLNSRRYRFIRARTTNEWLLDIQSSARDAAQLILDITGCFANATLIEKKWTF